MANHRYSLNVSIKPSAGATHKPEGSELPVYIVPSAKLAALQAALSPVTIEAPDWETAKSALAKKVQDEWKAVYGSNAAVASNGFEVTSGEPPVWEEPDEEAWFVHPAVVEGGKAKLACAQTQATEPTQIINISIRNTVL